MSLIVPAVMVLAVFTVCTPWMLYAKCVVVGLSGGVYVMMAVTMLSRHVGFEQRGRAVGLYCIT